MRPLRPSGFIPQLIRLMILLPLSFSGPLSSGWLETVSPGVASPQWKLNDLKGNEYRSGDYVGKAVLINFWTTWCPPCIEEMPSLIRLHQAMNQRGLVVLAINVEEGQRRVSAIARRLNLTFPVLLDSNRKVADAWNVSVFPSSFLIDTRGRLRYRAVGPVEWDRDDVVSRVAELLEHADQGTAE